MNQSRKFNRQKGFRPARRDEPLPREWSAEVEPAERERANAAMKELQRLVPGRGLILMTIPPGTSTQNVEAIACANNLTDRSQVASIFEAMLEWWSPQVVLAQPDRATVSALREGVGAIADIPIGEVCTQLGRSVTRLIETVRACKAGSADAIVHETLLIAVSALGIFAKFNAAMQHAAPGGSADGSGAPPPAPMPPPQKWPKGDTKGTLVADLLERPQSDARDQIIEMARAGKFHDYDSEVPAPKALLVEILSRFGFPELAGKARDGGYNDEHATAVQAEELRAEVGAAAFDAMTGNDPKKRGQS